MSSLRVDNLTKSFGLRTIFAGISFELRAGDIMAITGRNGSGKSTLLKLLANVTESTSGMVAWSIDGETLTPERLPRHIGFVAPYLQLYTEFNAWEHAMLIQEMRGLQFDAAHALELFERFGLAARRNDPIATFSSGMIQRVKFICALLHHPPFLLLDEPMTNLDIHGIATMRDTIIGARESRITIIATNEEDDVRLCNARLSVE